MRGVAGEPIAKRWLARGIAAGACIVAWGGSAGSGSSPKPRTRIEEVGRYRLVGEVAQDKDSSGLAFISDRFGLLQRRGVNIEGLATRQGRLYIGFRAPNLGGEAFVMEIRADDVFSGKPQPAYTLHRLRLGAGLGIRELTATRSSFVIIAGNAGSEPSEEYPQSEDYDKKRDFFLFHWDGTDAAMQRIGTLPKTDGQPEALAVLDETKDALTVLILFDGPKGGRPTVYRIS